MTDLNTASIIPLHQPKAALTPAQRAKAYRDRKRAQPAKPGKPVSAPSVAAPAPVTPRNAPVTPPRAVTPVTPRHAVTRLDASTVLTGTACGLAVVGVVMNGWFAHSLGSTDIAGWLFMAIGVAADLVALAVPTCAARLWRTHQRGAAAAGWVIWLATFAFAVLAGIGFASVNVSDVTASRASRVTPAVTAAQASLTDAMAARDRECKGGVGKNCRAREDAVTERRQALDAAMRAVEQSADPQTEAASRIVAWLSIGAVKPSGDDFAMLRLILLALLPQVGGILLMIGRGAAN